MPHRPFYEPVVVERFWPDERAVAGRAPLALHAAVEARPEVDVDGETYLGGRERVVASRERGQRVADELDLGGAILAREVVRGKRCCDLCGGMRVDEAHGA